MKEEYPSTKWAKQAIKKSYEEIIPILGLDISHPNFKETPRRVADAYMEILKGITTEAQEEINGHLLRWFPSDNDNMVISRATHAWGFCPHHFLPVHYKVDIAYIPSNRVIGLSKLPRLALLLAARPVMQEDLTKEIADKLQEVLTPQGVAVRVIGQHLCMQMRGVKAHNTDVVTTYLTGAFKVASAKEEFLRAIQ